MFLRGDHGILLHARPRGRGTGTPGGKLLSKSATGGRTRTCGCRRFKSGAHNRRSHHLTRSITRRLPDAVFPPKAKVARSNCVGSANDIKSLRTGPHLTVQSRKQIGSSWRNRTFPPAPGLDFRSSRPSFELVNTLARQAAAEAVLKDVPRHVPFSYGALHELASPSWSCPNATARRGPQCSCDRGSRWRKLQRAF